MRRYTFKKGLRDYTFVILIVVILLATASSQLYSQTTGTFSFSVTTTSTGGYTPEHLLAIWIENNSSAFVKTKIKYSSQSNLDHLATWTSKSGGNVVDAVTGATLTSHGTVTFLWNGTDVSGNLVSDGTYNVWLEMAWASSLTNGKTVNSFSFTKGPELYSSSPANTANFLSLNLTWTPSTTDSEKILVNNDIRVFPVPTSGLLNIEFRHALKDCYVRLINNGGSVVFEEKLGNIDPSVRSFNLGNLPSGIYTAVVHSEGRDIVFSIVIMN